MSTNRRCSPLCACADALRWLSANGHELSPLTGTSTKALKAVAHLWQLYTYSRDEAVIRAVAVLVPSLGSSAPLARELIAWVMDWDDRDKLWSRVVPSKPSKKDARIEEELKGCEEEKHEAD